MEEKPGLGAIEWQGAVTSDERPIDILADKTKHDFVLQYLLDRLRSSEEAMGKFYSRWRVIEKKMQGYINLDEQEEAWKKLNESGDAPRPISVVIPYTYATVATIVTYHLHTFAGQKPLFQVGSHKQESVNAARYMETILQYNADHTRLIKELHQWFQDGQAYGLGVLRTQWKQETAMRTVWRAAPPAGAMFLPQGPARTREARTVYEGNIVECIDPYMFFPDPHVPMSEVNKSGEYVFWRAFQGKHTLARMESAGEIKYLAKTPSQAPKNFGYAGEVSARNILAGGDTDLGRMRSSQQKNWYQVDEGTCWIIPAELGLGRGENPELWIFTILNKAQIVRAEPLELDHGKHPVSVIEPYKLGYGFGHMGITDFLAPLQDVISWFVNSHIHNVRAALNNMFVVDPSKIELGDLKKPGAGKIIRLKTAAYGQDVRSVLQQFQIADVTSQHIRDMELFMRLGDTLSAVTDNLRGLQNSGGRKTATEVRTSIEASASRLASQARIISAQGMTDLAEQMSLNIQQNMSEEFFYEITGEDGRIAGSRITPEMLVGDFNFPVHDGTLPMDRVAMLDVWKEIMMGVAQDQELRQKYSMGEIFEYVAELGGAKNIEQFRNAQPPGPEYNVQITPDEVAMELGQTMGTVAMPGRRAAGAI